MRTYFLVSFIFCLALVLKLGQLNSLPIDAHPMRQTDTACVIHFFVNNNLNILKPHTCLIRPTNNTEGLFFLEFPAYQWTVAISQILMDSQAYWTVRVVNLVLFSIAFWCLFEGCRNYFNQKIATFAVLIFSWLPAGIFFFGQAIHPDVFMIASLFAGWLSLTLYLKTSHTKHLLLLLTCLSLAVATRPFVAMSLPAFAFVLWQNKKMKAALLTLSFPFGLYGLWTLWQRNFPEASHQWQLWTLTGQAELLKVAVLKNLLWKNVVGEVLGKVVAGLAFLGVVSWKWWPHRSLYVFNWLYMLLIPVYWVIAPAGNLNHQYYAHVFIFPVIIFAAGFLNWLSLAIKQKHAAALTVGVISLLVVLNGYRTSRYFYILRASENETRFAEQIAQSIPANQKVIYLGESSLPISLAFRQGWVTAANGVDVGPDLASLQAVLPKAQYLILPHFDTGFPVQDLTLEPQNFTLVSQTPTGTIYKILSQ